jgi:hypothetical protein
MLQTETENISKYFSLLVEHCGSNFHKSMIFFHPSELGTLAYLLKPYLEASVGRLFSFKKYEEWPELSLPCVTSAS